MVDSRASGTSLLFAPDTLRPPTYFRGELRQTLEFREAMSALHDVVVSDLKWKPKDRTAYKQWLKEQNFIDWSEVASEKSDLKQQIDALNEELTLVRRRRAQRRQPWNDAVNRYFKYIYTRDKDMWYVLDPVITVHPDELFFECFSRDESSYGRLSVNYDVFHNVGEFACGTTNIDYSEALYNEFQKLRSWKQTIFEVDPDGFEVETAGETAFREVKIDLPDSWVRGFLQVSSALALPAAEFQLHPMDLYNVCFMLRRRRETTGPRALRYLLKPGHPVRVVVEPWNTILDCPRSLYNGDTEEEIRVWGRRRIHVLERLIPVAKSFHVQLLGNGMPSFYTADLGDLSFTLGLSGWTANDWSTDGHFDLLAPRAEVDSLTKQQVLDALVETWYESPDALAQRLGLDRAVVLGALSAWTQAGRAVWDQRKQVYRLRELTRDPLPFEALRFRNEREQAATDFVDRKQVKVTRSFANNDGLQIVEGTIQDTQGTHTTSTRINSDERLTAASCSCNWHRQNELRKGPCKHILALRMQYQRQQGSSWLRRLLGT